MEKNIESYKSRTRIKLELVLVFFAMFLLINTFLFSAVVVSTSMNPNYIEGERSIMFKPNFINRPQRGNVVVIDHHDEFQNKKRYFKRIIALPGDTFEIRNNEIYINGSQMDDPFRDKDTRMMDYNKILLADDEFFAMGDNRNNSVDSRELGPFKIKNIRAVNGIIYWPLDAAGSMR